MILSVSISEDGRDDHVTEKKAMQACIYGGANNHFDLDDFIVCLESQDWQDPDNLQLFIKKEEDERFSVYMFDRDGKIKKFRDGYDIMQGLVPPAL